MRIYNLLTIILLAALLAVGGIVVAQDETTNVAGEWAITLQFDPGEGHHTAIIEQNGESLTGIYRGQFLEGILTGTIEGNKIDFTGRIRHEINGGVSFHFSGTVDGETITGPDEEYDFPITIDHSDFWSSTFTMVRKKAAK